MGLKTRLDGRSEDNDRFDLKNERGEVIASICLVGKSSATLQIITEKDLHITKPNGWSSKK